jgi:TRAP-type C4-dicarboxylate transport system permease small subunit
MDLSKKIWENLEGYICFVLFTVMLVVLTFQVFLRYAFGIGVVWSDDLSRYCFQWLIYVSVALAAKRNAHIRVEAALSLFPKSLRKYGLLLGQLVWIAVGLFIVYQGVFYTAAIFQQQQVGNGLKIPLGYVYAAIPFGFLLMSIRAIAQLPAIFRYDADAQKAAENNPV